MADTFICINRLGVLCPVDQQGRDAVAKLKMGQQVQVEVKRARNGKQHRLYWALIGLIHSQQSRYATQEQLSNVIKCAVGWCDEVELKDGRLMVTPRSIAFANAKQEEFEQFFTKVIQLVITKILPGVAEADLRRELEEMVGVAA
jgi:transposase